MKKSEVQNAAYDEMQKACNAECVFTSTQKAATCKSCASTEKVVVIPRLMPGTELPVTALGCACFAKSKSAVEIVLPATVNTFGEKCFSGLSKLKKIVIGDKEGDFTFASKNGKLKAYVTLSDTYEVPETITEIDKYAFTGSPKLKTVVINHDITIHKAAFAHAVNLKTIVLGKNVTQFNLETLEKGNIKELVLQDGSSLTFQDKYLYECLEETPDGIVLNYKMVADNIFKVAKANRYKVAFALLQQYGNDLGDSASEVMNAAMRIAIEWDDDYSVNNLFSLGLDCDYAYYELIVLTYRCGSTKCEELIRSKADCEVWTGRARFETPANPGPERMVRVWFPGNQYHVYTCKFDVKVGDKVFVSGEKAGIPGEVDKFVKSARNLWEDIYMTDVIKAYNVDVVDKFDGSAVNSFSEAETEKN